MITAEGGLPPRPSLERVFRFFGCLVAGWLPAIIHPDAITRVASLYPLAESARPYLLAEHGVLLYLWAPMVVISGCLLFLSPGLLLALALNASRRVGEWILHGLAASLLFISPVVIVLESVVGHPLKGSAFAAVLAGCSLAALGFVIFRLRRGASLDWPFAERHETVTALSMLLVPLAVLAGLVPKFYWENFNGDGVHVFETARLLVQQPVPFWDPGAGPMAEFPGITSMLFIYPASWFIRLFGELELSVRAPILLYLPAMYGGLLELMRVNRQRWVGLAERSLVWLWLGIYLVVLAFSATYSPYSADIALPGTQDTLLIIWLLGFLFSFVARRDKWLVLFAVFTYLTAPNGSLLLGMWVLVVLFLWSPRPWRQLGLTLGTVLACVGIGALVPVLLATVGLPGPGGEYGLERLLARFAFLQWSAWERLAFVVVPAGILPAVALLAWRWQDRFARSLTLMTALYFGFFYFQANVSLHHFVPAMVLPLVVFGRSAPVLRARTRPWVTATAALTGLAALLLSLPEDGRPHTTARRVGSTIDDRYGGYENVEPESFRRSTIFTELFPPTWDARVPSERYGGSPLVWHHYAHRTQNRSDAVNYIVQPADLPRPIGARLVGRRDDVALYSRDDSVLVRDRHLRPPAPAGAAIYTIPRNHLFRSVLRAEGGEVIDVAAVLQRLGIDVRALLSSLGFEPEPANLPHCKANRPGPDSLPCAESAAR